MATRRTTHRSSKGKKLYAVRDADGQFKDVQTYKRAHGSDVKRRAKAERVGRRGVIGLIPFVTNDPLDRVTRFEVIDETGRAYVKTKVITALSHQDEGRTLKVFVEPRKAAKRAKK